MQKILIILKKTQDYNVNIFNSTFSLGTGNSNVKSGQVEFWGNLKYCTAPCITLPLPNKMHLYTFLHLVFTTEPMIYIYRIFQWYIVPKADISLICSLIF